MRLAARRTSGLISSGLGCGGGGGGFGAVGGGGGGTGHSNPSKTTSSLVSNTSTVRGLSIVNTSATGSPVEMPKGATTRPKVEKSGYLVVSPTVINAVSILSRSTATSSSSVVRKKKSVPSKYSIITLPTVQ